MTINEWDLMLKPGLKDCPFCGDQAIVEHSGYRKFHVTCLGQINQKCMAITKSGTIIEAIDGWNKRVS